MSLSGDSVLERETPKIRSEQHGSPWLGLFNSRTYLGILAYVGTLNLILLTFAALQQGWFEKPGAAPTTVVEHRIERIVEQQIVHQTAQEYSIVSLVKAIPWQAIWKAAKTVWSAFEVIYALCVGALVFGYLFRLENAKAYGLLIFSPWVVIAVTAVSLAHHFEEMNAASSEAVKQKAHVYAPF